MNEVHGKNLTFGKRMKKNRSLESSKGAILGVAGTIAKSKKGGGRGRHGSSGGLTLGMADWMHCSRRLSLSEELSPESLRLGRWPEAWRSFRGSSPGMDSVERSEMEAA